MAITALHNDEDPVELPGVTRAYDIAATRIYGYRKIGGEYPTLKGIAGDPVPISKQM